MEKERFYKMLPLILVVSVTVWANLYFLQGSLFPIAHGTVRGGIVSAFGVAVILAVAFGMLLLIRYFQQKRKYPLLSRARSECFNDLFTGIIYGKEWKIQILSLLN